MIHLLFALFFFVSTYGCELDRYWKPSSPDWIQIIACDSGFQYRVCNHENQWENVQNQQCECSNEDVCYRDIYNGVLRESNASIPTIMSSIPSDMETSVPLSSSVHIYYSELMQRGSGHGLLRSQDSATIVDSFMKTECIKKECTISFNSLLQSDTFYELELDPDFFVSEYGLPLQNSYHIVFKTQKQSCTLQSIEESLSDSHLCSCFSDQNACICNCGDVQVHRGF